MLPVELYDAEKRRSPLSLIKQTKAADPFPMSQRVRQLRAILEKVQPPTARPQPYLAAKPPGTSNLVLARKKGGGVACYEHSRTPAR